MYSPPPFFFCRKGRSLYITYIYAIYIYIYVILLSEGIKALNITTILTPLYLALLVNFFPNLTEHNGFTQWLIGVSFKEEDLE